MSLKLLAMPMRRFFTGAVLTVFALTMTASAATLDAIRTSDYINYSQIVFEFSKDNVRTQVTPIQAGASMLQVKLSNVSASSFGREHKLDSRFLPKASFSPAAAGWLEITIPLHENIDASGIKWHNWDNMLSVSLPFKRPNHSRIPTAEEITMFRNNGGKVIVIDPGHGAFNNGGTAGRYTQHPRQREKEVMLDVAKRLEALFKQDPDFLPLLTRSGDYLPAPFEFSRSDNTRREFISSSLLHRVKLAKEFQGDLYVSLHLNAPARVSQQRTIRGYEIYYFGENHARSLYDNPNRDIEELETLGIIHDANDDSLSDLINTIKKDSIIPRSKELAAAISEEMRGMVPFRSPYIKSNRFKVISQLNMPSVLIEYLFITHPDEHEWVRSSANRNRLAEATYRGIRNFFYNSENPMEYSYDELVQASLEREKEEAARPQYKLATHTVRTGETLSTIAQRYGISVSRLKSLNQGIIGSRDRIYAGKTRLNVPVSGGSSSSTVASVVNYTVRSGDTLEKIALRHKTSITALRNLNGISGSRIYPGQTLRVKPGDQSISYAAAAEPIRYTVKRGDTLSGIASRFGISHSTIKRYNGLRSNTIRPGQKITIPR